MKIVPPPLLGCWLLSLAHQQGSHAPSAGECRAQLTVAGGGDASGSLGLGRAWADDADR